MSSDPFAALDQLVRQKNSQIPKRQKAAITPPKPRKTYKKPRPSETLKKRKSKIGKDFHTNPNPKTSTISKKWQSRPKSKSLRSNIRKKPKTKNAYLEVDNRKYLEFKLGDEKKKKANQMGRKKIGRHGVKGNTNRKEKERNREKMERKRIMKETRQWAQEEEEEEEEVPVRGNNGGKGKEEYTARGRRKRYCG
jgi:hypothetical protein